MSVNRQHLFSVWLKQERRALRLTQNELAQRLAYAVHTIRAIEQGKLAPSDEFIGRVAAVLHISPLQFEAFRAFAHGERSTFSTATPNTLPATTTSFVGRASELSLIAARLRDPACRLLTLTGVGGIGKTRLAIEAARSQAALFPDGVWWVTLASTDHSASVDAILVQALALPPVQTLTAQAQLSAYLKDKTALLVLDNCDQPLESAGLFASLLASAPQLKLLVTSRERLHLQAEWLLEVGGLPVDSTAETPSEALTLFAQRARQIIPEFDERAHYAAALRICRAVEGLPLGIELAAAWLRSYTPEQLADQLERGYADTALHDLPAGLHDLPERHRSLRAIFGHSWAMLSDAERNTLAALSIFRGGFDEQSALAVADATPALLASLLDKSLLRRSASRYDMHEQIRQYAFWQLKQAKQAEAARDRHLRYFTEFAEQHWPSLENSGHSVWLNRFRIEMDNFRAALSWGIADRARLPLALQLVGALYWFWQVGDIREGGRWSEAVLACVDPTLSSSHHARAIYTAAAMRFFQGDLVQSAALCERGTAMWRAVGDPVGLGYGLAGYGFLMEALGEPERASEAYAEQVAIGQELGRGSFCLLALSRLGIIALRNGDSVQAQRYLAEARSWYKGHAAVWLYMFAVQLEGEIAIARGDFREALRVFEFALTHWLNAQDLGSTITILARLGEAALYAGEIEYAQTVYERMWQYSHDLGNPLGKAGAKQGMACVVLWSGDEPGAIRLLTEALDLFRAVGFNPGVASCLADYAELARRRGASAEALRLISLSQMLDATRDTSMYSARGGLNWRALQDWLAGCDARDVEQARNLVQRLASADLDAVTDLLVS